MRSRTFTPKDGNTMNDTIKLTGKVDDITNFEHSGNSTPWGAAVQFSVGGIVRIKAALTQKTLAVLVESLDGAAHVVSLNFAASWPKEDPRPRQLILGEGWTGKSENEYGFSCGGALETGETYTAKLRLTGDENDDGVVDSRDLGIALGLLRHQTEIAALLGNWG